MRDFSYLRLGIRDFKAKTGRDSGLKVCAGGGMPKITLGITGLPETLGRDYGIEKPYLGPSAYLPMVSKEGKQTLIRTSDVVNYIPRTYDDLACFSIDSK